ncbi:hypothetical protein ACUXST_000679 [Sphingomonas sp. F9_3S_D5_B_2]
MFNFLKKRREKAERAAELQELGRVLGESLDAEVELFIEMNIVPRRKAFLEVLHGQIAQIDARLKELDPQGELSRYEAAAIDVRIMLENWDNHKEDELKSARQALAEEYRLAEAAGVSDDFQALVERSLAEQRLILLTDSMAAINEVTAGTRATNAPYTPEADA